MAKYAVENPAAVCLLESAEEENEEWMQSIAKEFNVAVTSFLYRIGDGGQSVPRFSLRWFTALAHEVEICGHATLAAAHFLLTFGYANSNIIEFATKFGILTAKNVNGLKKLGPSKAVRKEQKVKFAIELDFPMISLVGGDSSSRDALLLPQTLFGTSAIAINKTSHMGDIIVELDSWKDVVAICPNFNEIRQLPGRGVIVTAPAPPGSGFDIYSRFFYPKLGVNEDHVCGSAHCSLAPYWAKKLGKTNLIAYMASPRSGRLDLQIDEEKSRVYIQGKAVTIMEGTIIV